MVVLFICLGIRPPISATPLPNIKIRCHKQGSCMFNIACFAILRIWAVFALKEVLVEIVLVLPGMICPSDSGFSVAQSSRARLDRSCYEVLE